MKKFKWVLALFMCLAMVLTFIPQTSFADDESYSGKCGDNITWTLDSEGTLEIWGTGAMEESPSWLDHRSDIKTVKIDGITNIGGHAFAECNNLESVAIPKSVTSIDSGAFLNCSALKSITIPESVSFICDTAFGDCHGLKSIVFAGNTPPNIDLMAFTGVTATAYYPANSETSWTGVINIGGYGGNLKWEASHLMHDRSDTLPRKEATCTETGITEGVILSDMPRSTSGRTRSDPSQRS